MSSELGIAATGSMLTQHGEPVSCRLHHLPAALFHLILQHLSLAEQLNHCTHLCKRCPPPSANSLRCAPLLLSDSTVQRMWQSLRLFDLLSAATDVMLHIDTAPRTSRTVRFVSTSALVPSFVPSLARLTVQLSRAALSEEVAKRRRQPVAANLRPDSVAFLLPFLSARSATLRSLHIVQPCLTMELSPLLAPLTSLRRLCIAAPLSTEIMLTLLNTPLDVLDLSGSTLTCKRSDFEPPLLSVADSALLHCCRILCLPQIAWDLPRVWVAYLDAMVTERTSTRRPHTLLVQHEMSAAVFKQLLTSPPSRSLRIPVASWAALNAAIGMQRPYEVDGVAPAQLELSVKCYDLLMSVRPFMRFALRYCHNIRSIRLSRLPQQEQVTARLLKAVSHCSNLETLSLTASPNCAPWPDEPTAELEWALLPHRLTRLHTLKLPGVTGTEADVCRLLSACLSLRACALDLGGLSIAMLRVLAACCPLLSRLRLRISFIGCLVSSTAVSEEPTILFPSLLQLDLHLLDHVPAHPLQWDDVCTALRSSVLHGSPSQLLKLGLSYHSLAAQHPLAVVPLLLALPRLERLRTSAEELPWLDDALSGPAWDAAVDDDGEDEDEDEEEKRPVHLSSTPLNGNSAASPVDSLHFIVSPAFLPIHHFIALLRHCPTVTHIHLTIHALHGLHTFLRCLAHIGRHCPLIERITYSLDAGACSALNVRVLSLDDVELLVNCEFLPEHAFRFLQSVRDVGTVVQVMSAEAARYVRQCWMSRVQVQARMSCLTLPECERC